MNLLLVFIILNIINVVLQTIKSLATVKCGKGVAAIVNALAYGLYTYVIIYTNADLPMFTKACVVALTNLIGVYIVKSVEEKLRKDKLWKIECTASNDCVKDFMKELVMTRISFNHYPIDKYYTGFNVYAYNQTESQKIKEILKNYNVKYFVSESKIL